MGGFGAHEYMAPCPAGENDVAVAPGYAANVEVASADAQPVELPSPIGAPQPVETPAMTTIEAVASHLDLPAGALLKAFPVIVESSGEMKLVMLRGDHRVNEIKLRLALKEAFRAAHPDEVEQRLGPPGYIGPVGDHGLAILLDAGVAANTGANYVTGANRPDEHLRGVEPGRDFEYETVDVRTVVDGDTINGSAIRIEPAIEVGNIFKLGLRYSTPLGASYLDENGHSQPIWMGSYGFGPARAAAAAVEQYFDEHGISWPRSIAPFDVEVVVIGADGSEERALADSVYGELLGAGLAVLYDDRDAGPGEKFADAELLGCPLRVTIGRKTRAAGEIEVQIRRGRESRAVPIEGAARAIDELWRGLP
jgi:prolyl-tRNA synthetase